MTHTPFTINCVDVEATENVDSRYPDESHVNSESREI